MSVESVALQTGALGIVAWVVHFTLTRLETTLRNNTKATIEILAYMKSKQAQK